ncbi:MAG: substrate-binding domain-containing protein [Myxococcales bacterium]
MATAHERGWTLLHYDNPSYLHWLADALAPIAAVVASDFGAPEYAALSGAGFVCVTSDSTASGIASVCLDEAAIGKLAYEHLRGTGVRHVTTFRFDESPFAVARDEAFLAAARAGGTRVAQCWGLGEGQLDRRENPAELLAWLRGLPKPCGIFTCTDGWARTVARYAQLAGLRIPEDIALVGADNDELECELMSPPLSSVLIPWREVGRSAASLVHGALSGKPHAGERVVVAPLTVIARRSSELMAVDDALVARAVEWIRSSSHRRIVIPTLARAVASGRHRLERAFRRVLGRTIQAEIRRARVEAAKKLLEASSASLAEVAKMSGFKTASLLSVAFQRELGMTPGAYRRVARAELTRDEAD